MANSLARHLRNNATDAERLLWKKLRLLKSEGRHFRRQVPIGNYIVDFACYSCRLIVEVDGGQHGMPRIADTDKTRSVELEKCGFRFIRFWNSQIYENLEGTMEMIRHAARLPTLYNFDGGATPTPNPSPQGGGE